MHYTVYERYRRQVVQKFLQLETKRVEIEIQRTRPEIRVVNKEMFNPKCHYCLNSREKRPPRGKIIGTSNVALFSFLPFRSVRTTDQHRYRPPEVDRPSAKPHRGEPSGKDQGQVSASLEEVGSLLSPTPDKIKTRGPLQHRGIL